MLATPHGREASCPQTSYLLALLCWVIPARLLISEYSGQAPGFQFTSVLLPQLAARKADLSQGME